MKIKHAMLALLVVVPFGCAREEMALEVPDIAGVPLNIDGAIDQIPTRAGESGFANGDALGLFAVNWLDDNTVAGTLAASGNQADNAKYTYDASAFKWTTVRPVYYKDAETHADLYVYYPYQRNINDVDTYGFEVKMDQSAAAADGQLSGYEASDFLWCKVEDVTPSENKVKARLQHRMAGAKVTLQEGTGFEEDEFDSVSKSVILLNTARKATINFSTGVVTKLGSPQDDGIVMAVQNDGSFRAVVVPQTVQNVPFFALTVDGQTYRYQPGSAPCNYMAGKLTEFTITINKNAPSGTYTFDVISTSITDWTEDANTHAGEARQYYVVNVTTPGTLGATITAAGKNPDRIRNLKVTGTVNTDDFYFMRDHMAILEAVNMKECRVVDAKYNDADGAWDPELRANIKIGDNIIPYRALDSKKTLTSFVFPESVEYIDFCSFARTNLSGALIIPNDVTRIGVCAFGYTNISSLSLPQGLITIESQAFYGCTLTGELLLPQTIKRIGASAFFGCRFTGALKLPESLESIQTEAFYNAGSFVGDLEIPEKITSLYNTFNGSTFTGSLHLNNCTSVGGATFSGCGFVGELIIPEGTVDISNDAFAGNCFTSVSFPSTLKTIGERSLSNNPIEEVVLPEGLVSIGNQAFWLCKYLQNVELPSSLQTIKEGAFLDCFGISSIISHASTPPTVFDGAFNGVGKDNFTVEVPEASLVSYQTETGWSDFKRYASYQNFSISRRLARALNNGKSQIFTLRCPAEMAWTVADKPDWITVTPSSGMGKTDVTVTFAAMARTDDTFEREEWNGTQYISTGTYKGRAGEVVFELTAKGNQSSLRVEQFDYDWYDSQVYTAQTHTVGDGINIVLTGDGYDALDIATGSFMDDMDEAVEHFFDLEPYHTYQDRFNVYYVFAESDESGIGTLNTVKDTKFGSYIGENRMVAPDTDLIFEYALKTPVTSSNLKDALVIMIDNTSLYEGVTYMYGDGSAIASCPKSSLPYPYDFRGIVQHEAGGHGFGKLADEYIYHNAFISTCLCQDGCDHGRVFNAMKARGWYRNLEFTGSMYDVAWSHLIFNPTYSDKVDVYEGGYMHSRGVFRSEATSCMNNNIPYYSAISRQAMVERILTLSGEGFTLDKFYTNDSFRVGAVRVSGSGKRAGTSQDLDVEYMPSHEHGPVYMGEHPVLK